jgi:NAD(P)-dependent dehydrogenase (short-subunit alcohol dehydrogenase family)
MSASQGRKTIFITGAGSGIGRATAQHFARKGWFTGLYDVNAAGLAETAAALPAGQCVSGVFDVRDREGWSTAIAQFADATGGRMHVLFNNAGIGRHGWYEDVPQDEADLIVDVNLKGVMNGIYAALPLLEATPGARVVNTASTAGIIGSPKLAVYSATKFAVRGLTEALDVEFSGKGIRVACLTPWFVDTPILDMGTGDRSNHKMSDDIRAAGMAVYPVEMAAEAAWEAAHGEATIHPVGKAAKDARFMARFFPNALRKRLIKTLAPR